jgi:uncharacterized protein
MELTDALRVPLSPLAVAEALGDGALLRASLENCESFTRRPSGEHALVFTVPVGSLRGRYEIRMHAASPDGDASPADGAKPFTRTLNFKASATGVGSLRGQIGIELEEDAPAAHEGKRTGSDVGEDRGSGATLIRYAIWATPTGPLAGLAPRQVENALRALVDDFFAEFSAVVEAKYGKGPNRARMGAGRRQHVFLRPISLAGLARRPASSESSDACARRAGDMLVGQRGTQGLDCRGPKAMPVWAWAAAFAVGVALLYVLHRFE